MIAHISRTTRRFLLPLLAFFLSLSALLAVPQTSYAYDKALGTNLKMKPTTWCQYCAQSDYGYDQWINEPYGLSREPMGPAACGQFTGTATLVRAGVKPRGYTVIDYIKDNQALQQAGKDPMSSVNWIYFQDISREGFAQAVTNMSGGQLEYVNDSSSDIGTYSKEQIKQWYDEGYFMSLLTTGHWITVDYVSSDGVIHTIDSGSEATSYDPANYGETYRQGRPSKIELVLKFKRTDGKKPTDLPKADEAATDSTADKSKDKKSGRGTLTEQDLIGMPPRTEGYVTQISQAEYQAFQDTARLTEEASRASLSAQEADNVDQIQATKEMENASKIDSTFRITAAVIGVLFILYGLILFLAFVFDYMQAFINLTTIVSLGYLHTVRGDTDTPPAHGRWATPRNLLTTVFVFTALGGLIINGWLVTWVTWLMEAISHAIS